MGEREMALLGAYLVVFVGFFKTHQGFDPLT